MKHAQIIATSITGLVLIAGCMSRETDRTLSADHPAHPQAKESPFTPPSKLLAEKVSPAPAKTPVTQDGATYTCPMHPEVRMTAPGKCPKCGITLGPIATNEGNDNKQAHEHGMAM